MNAKSELLVRLYRRHVTDPVAALHRLESHLKSVDLPFDLTAQLRELEYPPQPGLPNGLPSFIYYYVPNSRRGSEQTSKYEALHPSFLNTADGIGLNLGCPVRLLRALDALSQLPPNDQCESRHDLRCSTEHLCGIEELLWLTGWKSTNSLKRGGQIPGAKGDVDWSLVSNELPILIEAKFRQSDWPRLSEKNSFVLLGNGFLSNALHKFPTTLQSTVIQAVGLTMFDNIDEQIMHLIGLELQKAPQIHAVIVRSLLGMTHVISLSVEIRDRVLKMLSRPSINDFPVNHGIIFGASQRDARVANKLSTDKEALTSKAVCWSIEPSGKLSYPVPPPDIYRLDIPTRGADGEPHFKIIPKYLTRTKS
jgi:hypothetical protein